MTFNTITYDAPKEAVTQPKEETINHSKKCENALTRFFKK
jgi:hypothetical protein